MPIDPLTGEEYDEDETEFSGPLYEHDCASCEFYGRTTEGFDLYRCKSTGSWVGRHGPDPDSTFGAPDLALVHWFYATRARWLNEPPCSRCGEQRMAYYRGAESTLFCPTCDEVTGEGCDIRAFRKPRGED